MSVPIITVENLGKRYQLGGNGGASGGYRTLRESLSEGTRRLFARDANGTKAQEEEFWALRDVSFSVWPGEVVGIIGRNGAGKSTLLKILSRITDPTEGRVTLRGRVASLLEVGTGFHPELTGRENIYLNGAVLGMQRAEIRRKFDEIVAFAEVERFLDTPVKRYSSGMYVRLAFAVAAHLEPEILIVDEVLAVGDAQFQKKCLGKMGEVAEGGRTVLFVSHNMAVVTALCSRCVLLHAGSVVTTGDMTTVVDRYLALGQSDLAEVTWSDPAHAPGNQRMGLAAVRVVSEQKVSSEIDIAEGVSFEVDYRVFQAGVEAALSIHLVDQMGTIIFATANFPSASLEPDRWYGRRYPPGLYRSRCTLPANFLNEGTYRIHVFLLTGISQIEVKLEDALTFTAHDSGAMRKEYTGHWAGLIRPKLHWQTESLEGASTI